MQEQLEKIAKHFGLSSQLNKLQEENAELIVAISKVKIEGFTQKRLDELIEEIADVEIMLEQVKGFLKDGICTNVDTVLYIKKQAKISRTMEVYSINE